MVAFMRLKVTVTVTVTLPLFYLYIPCILSLPHMCINLATLTHSLSLTSYLLALSSILLNCTWLRH